MWIPDRHFERLPFRMAPLNLTLTLTLTLILTPTLLTQTLTLSLSFGMAGQHRSVPVFMG